MWKLLKSLRALSLDICLGAVVFAAAIAKFSKVDLEAPVLGALFLVTWIIYTFDHISDISTDRPLPDTFRHQFHHKWRPQLIVACTGAVVLAIFLVTILPTNTLAWGIVVSVYMILYFILLRHTDFWYKELAIAFGYASGITLVTFTHPGFNLGTSSALLLWLIVFMVALINVFLIAIVDHQTDKTSGLASISKRLSPMMLRKSTWVFWSFAVLCLFILGVEVGHLNGFLFCISLMLLWEVVLIWLVIKSLGSEWYRVMADATFLLPGIYLIFF